MTVRAQLWFWFFVLVGSALLVWGLRDILLPFIAGLAVAYLLNPLVEKLSNWKIGRATASALILAMFLMLVVVALLGTLPFIAQEVSALIATIPDILVRAQMVMVTHVPMTENIIAGIHLDDLPTLIQSHAAQAVQVTSNLAGKLATGGQAVLGTLMFIALMPVVAFYMMARWPQIVGSMDELFPRAHADTIRDLIRQMDGRISGFIRGQIIVCFLLAFYYALGLSLVGLQYGFLIGLLAGLLSIIPFIGSIFGLVASVAIALFQVPVDGWSVLALALAVFAVGQFVEGNFITPKIVGDRVGLHPLWIIFALLAGGSLMGIVGMLLAVPVAAVIAVLIGFVIKQYKASLYFTGGKARG